EHVTIRDICVRRDELLVPHPHILPGVILKADQFFNTWNILRKLVDEIEGGACPMYFKVVAGNEVIRYTVYPFGFTMKIFEMRFEMHVNNHVQENSKAYRQPEKVQH